MDVSPPHADSLSLRERGQSPLGRRRWGQQGRGEGLLLLCGLAVGLAARLAFAFLDDGLLWPDEYYQSLEPAHRAVFGYGWQAWEFLEGARHWTLPGFIALIIRAANGVGLDYLAAVETVFCLTGAATSLAVFSLARAQGASRVSSAIVATVFSLMGLAIYLSPRAMGETLSALPITFALARSVRAELKTKDILVLGALLTLGVALRLQNGLFCLFVLGLLFRTQRRAALQLFGVLVVGALLYGAIDWLTWGKPFHSALTYLRFNLIEGKSSSFGTHHFFLYFQALFTAEGLTIVPLVVLSVLGFKSARAIPLMALGFVLVHSLIPHKELRFIFPAIPLLAAHAALGLDRFPERRRVALLGFAVVSLLTFPTLTFGRLGISNPARSLSAIDYVGPENRLLKRARTLEDLCGLRIASNEWWRTGGYAYLHREVPMYGPRDPEGHYNYVIARRGEVVGTEVAHDGDRVLVRVDLPCSPDPAYDWHLE
jgi:GPI mannosyltransferase 3